MTKKTMGYAMASYYGGRAEVRVRHIAVPVAVVDFTSMYPTIFIRQKLQGLIGRARINQRIVTDDARRLLESITLDHLYDPNVWPKFNRIALVQPEGDILPVRMRMNPDDPFTIAITPFTSPYGRWYTLADLIAAKLLGGAVPRIVKAIEFVGNGINRDLHSIDFLGATFDPDRDIMATVIEERHRAMGSELSDPDASRREKALKVLAASAGYGIYAEINVAARPGHASRPRDSRFREPREALWYSDVGPETGEVHDERPGRFFSPVVASLVTGGARLMLAMAEAEVTNRGGTFAFCDTDSLAIVAGTKAPQGIPCLKEADVAEIIDRFDPLNPYDSELIPHLLKREYAEAKELQCYAISAKRYVLFTRDQQNRLRIVKASESGIGSIIGRTANETIPKLARRIWTAILIDDLAIRYRGLRKARMGKLLAFDVPMRRKLPISQPSIWSSRGFRAFNRGKVFDHQIKPFGFLQTVTAAIEMGKAIRPIAPFERDLARSRDLTWTDLESKKSLDLDWDGHCRVGAIPVMRLDEFIANYALHREAKAAGPDGWAATEQTKGVLGRLHLYDGQPIRIGKEVDRLDQDDDSTLDSSPPIEYKSDDLAKDITYLAMLPQETTAYDLGLSVRRWRDIASHRAEPRERTAEKIARVAARYRFPGHG